MNFHDILANVTQRYDFLNNYNVNKISKCNDVHYTEYIC